MLGPILHIKGESSAPNLDPKDQGGHSLNFLNLNLNLNLDRT